MAENIPYIPEVRFRAKSIDAAAAKVLHDIDPKKYPAPKEEGAVFGQEMSDTQFLKEFVESLEFPKKSSLSADQQAIIGSMPHKQKKILAEVAAIEAAIARDQAVDATAAASSPAEFSSPKAQILRQKRDQKIAEKLSKVAQEVFIVACASNLPIKQVVAFAEASKLSVEARNGFDAEGKLNPLFAALAAGRSKEDFIALTDAGCNINVTNKVGNNLAHFAVEIGAQVDDVKMLIALGVNANAENAFGMTPADMAEVRGNDDMFSILAEEERKKAVAEAKAEAQEKGEKGETLEGEKGEKLVGEDGKEVEGKESKKTKDGEEKEDDLEKEEGDEKEGGDALREKKLSKKPKEKKKAPAKKENKIKTKDDVSDEFTDADQFLEDDQPSEDEQSAESGFGFSREAKVDDKGIDDKGERSKTDHALQGKADQTLQERIEDAVKIGDNKTINSLFHEAVSTGKNNEALLLLHHGANVNVEINGESALDIAAKNGNNFLVSIFAGHASNNTLQGVLEDMVHTHPEFTAMLIQNNAVAAGVVHSLETILHAKPPIALLPESTVVPAAEEVPEESKKEEKNLDSAEPKKEDRAAIITPMDILAMITGIANVLIAVGEEAVTEISGGAIEFDGEEFGVEEFEGEEYEREEDEGHLVIDPDRELARQELERMREEREVERQAEIAERALAYEQHVLELEREEKKRDAEYAEKSRGWVRVVTTSDHVENVTSKVESRDKSPQDGAVREAIKVGDEGFWQKMVEERAKEKSSKEAPTTETDKSTKMSSTVPVSIPAVSAKGKGSGRV